MVIENTVDATPIIEPAMTVRMSLAPLGRAGMIHSTRFSPCAKPLRSSQIMANASAAAPTANKAG